MTAILIIQKVSDRIKISDPKRPRLFFQRSETHPKKTSLVPSDGYFSVRTKVTKGSFGGHSFAGLPIGQQRIPRLNEDGPGWIEFQSVDFEFYNEISRSGYPGVSTQIADQPFPRPSELRTSISSRSV
jgi:hypothetical protein